VGQHRIKVLAGAAPAVWLATMLREAKGRRPLQLGGAAFDGWTRCGRSSESRLGRVCPAPGSTVPRPKIAASGAPIGAASYADKSTQSAQAWLRWDVDAGCVGSGQQRARCEGV